KNPQSRSPRPRDRSNNASASRILNGRLDSPQPAFFLQSLFLLCVSVPLWQILLPLLALQHDSQENALRSFHFEGLLMRIATLLLAPIALTSTAAAQSPRDYRVDLTQPQDYVLK